MKDAVEKPAFQIGKAPLKKTAKQPPKDTPGVLNKTLKKETRPSKKVESKMTEVMSESYQIDQVLKSMPQLVQRIQEDLGMLDTQAVEKMVALGFLQARADSHHDFMDSNRCKSVSNVEATLPLQFSNKVVSNLVLKSGIPLPDNDTNESNLVDYLKELDGYGDFCSRAVIDEAFYELMHQNFGNNLAFVYDQGHLPPHFFTDIRDRNLKKHRFNVHTIASSWDEAGKLGVHQVSISLHNGLPPTFIRYTSHVPKGILFNYTSANIVQTNSCGIYERLNLTSLQLLVTQFSVAQMCAFMSAAQARGNKLTLDDLPKLVEGHLLNTDKFNNPQFTGLNREAIKREMVEGFMNAVAEFQRQQQLLMEKPVSVLDAVFGLCYDIKRSMDSGQCDMVNTINRKLVGSIQDHVSISYIRDSKGNIMKDVTATDLEQLGSIDKCFLVTGDRLCFMRAKVDNVPAVLIHPQPPGVAKDDRVFRATVFCKDVHVTEQVFSLKAQTILSSIPQSLPELYGTNLAALRRTLEFINAYLGSLESHIQSKPEDPQSAYLTIQGVKALYEEWNTEEIVTHTAPVNLALFHLMKDVFIGKLKAMVAKLQAALYGGENPLASIYAFVSGMKFDALDTSMNGENYQRLLNAEKCLKFIQAMVQESYRPCYKVVAARIDRIRSVVSDFRLYMLAYVKNAVKMFSNEEGNAGDPREFDDDGDATMEEYDFTGLEPLNQEAWEGQWTEIVSKWNNLPESVSRDMQKMRAAISNAIGRTSQIVSLITLDHYNYTGAIYEYPFKDISSFTSGFIAPIQSMVIARQLKLKNISANMNLNIKVKALGEELQRCFNDLHMTTQEMKVATDSSYSGLSNYVQERHNLPYNVKAGDLEKFKWIESLLPFHMADILMNVGVDGHALEYVIKKFMNRKFIGASSSTCTGLSWKLIDSYVSSLRNKRANNRDTLRQDLLDHVLKPCIVEFEHHAAHIEAALDDTLAPLLSMDSMAGGGQARITLQFPAQSLEKTLFEPKKAVLSTSPLPQLQEADVPSRPFLSSTCSSILDSYKKDLLHEYVVAVESRQTLTTYEDGTNVPVLQQNLLEWIDARVMFMYNYMYLFKESIVQHMEDTDSTHFDQRERMYQGIVKDFEDYMMKGPSSQTSAKDHLMMRLIKGKQSVDAVLDSDDDMNRILTSRMFSGGEAARTLSSYYKSYYKTYYNRYYLKSKTLENKHERI